MQRLGRLSEHRLRTPKRELGPDIAALAPDARMAAKMVWTRRCSNEQASIALARQLLCNLEVMPLAEQHQWGPPLARLLEDEERHYALAVEVLRALHRADSQSAGATDANHASLHLPASKALAKVGSCALEAFAYDVFVGLFLCETVSAARFASVLMATDLPAFRERIVVLFRDEMAHARLGALLLRPVRTQLIAEKGRSAADAFIMHATNAAVAELTLTIAGGLSRDSLPPIRPQPEQNPGVVEPNIDAHAFYSALERRVHPTLVELLGES